MDTIVFDYKFDENIYIFENKMVSKKILLRYNLVTMKVNV